MSDETYKTQSPPQPNPSPYQSGQHAEEFNRIKNPVNQNQAAAQTGAAYGSYLPPPPPPPHYQHPSYPQYPPVYFQPPSQPKSLGCFGFLLYGLASVGVCLICLFLLIVGSLYCFVVGISSLDSLSNEDSMRLFDTGEKQLSEKFVSGNKEAKQKIAVISIDGMITEELDGFVAKQIKQVQNDNKVVAVVLRVDSPGGTMTGSDYYHYLLKRMKADRDIPVIVSMGGIAASGGYYVSMVGDEILAEPTTITGSIGVIVSLFNASELCQKIGVESTPITSGTHKAMGNFAKKMSEDERKIWQNLVDDSFARFKKIIQGGRKEFAKNPEKLDKLATGQIYTANEAVENKLIDGIGYLDDAVEKALTAANISERDSKVIKYKKKTGFSEIFMESRAPDTLLDSKTLTEKSTPKVLLLCPYVVP